MAKVRIIESSGRCSCTENNPCKNCRDTRDKVKAKPRVVPDDETRKRILKAVSDAIQEDTISSLN